MRTLWGISWGALAAFAVLLGGCDSGGEPEDARAALDDAEQAVDARTEEVLPVALQELRAAFGTGTAGFESCTMGLAGDARYVAKVQLRQDAGVPPEEAASRVAAQLESAGWTLGDDSIPGRLEAERDGVTLSLTTGQFATDLWLESACVEASDDLTQEYTERDQKDIPAP
ncbi:MULTISPECIES: hypothetical protein [Nocardioides]|uniref:Lipoprotein n=1 Tax=Nocardioides vastitatis TaxID=2568655 RepID=A0ABW0ZK62_9ACTN|nr:hypothetical protein [Nocardioides sp.]THI96920.1 hypothetical protein E7Z54_15595 [Nocardioides sp.]